jgi:hypothetical protein
MARKDVINYFLEQQGVYLELISNVKDLDEAFKKGQLSEEQIKIAKEDINIAKNNYDRIAYIIMLLNKPKDKANRKKEEQFNKNLYDSLHGASREAVLDESKDALLDFKKLIKESKNNQNGTN